MSAPVVSHELRILLRRVKLGRSLDTLPERLALAGANGLGHRAGRRHRMALLAMLGQGRLRP